MDKIKRFNRVFKKVTGMSPVDAVKLIDWFEGQVFTKSKNCFCLLYVRHLVMALYPREDEIKL